MSGLALEGSGPTPSATSEFHGALRSVRRLSRLALREGAQAWRGDGRCAGPDLAEAASCAVPCDG